MALRFYEYVWRRLQALRSETTTTTTEQPLAAMQEAQQETEQYHTNDEVRGIRVESPYGSEENEIYPFSRLGPPFNFSHITDPPEWFTTSVQYRTDNVITSAPTMDNRYKRLWHTPADIPSDSSGSETITIVYLTTSGDSRMVRQETIPANPFIWTDFVAECHVDRWCYLHDLISEQPFIRRSA